MADTKYIFVVMDDYEDYDTIQKVTTDWKLAFEYAFTNNYHVNIWCDGAIDSMLKIFCYNAIGWYTIALDKIKSIKDECLRIQIEKYLNDKINELNYVFSI